MGKRKRAGPTIEDVLERPWCYYCERDFDDLKVLIAHQKAKHYKCEMCNRRLNTAGGLSVHMSQVHKETLTKIENALPGRADPNLEIFGMHGVPDPILDQHKHRITTEYFAAVAIRQAETGNPPPGPKEPSNETDATVKKPKIETPEELRKRLAEFKAKREAERGAKVSAENNSSNASTPMNGATPFSPPAADIKSQQPTPVQQPEQLQYQNHHVQSPFQHGPHMMHPGMHTGFAVPPPALSPAPVPMFAGSPQGMPPHFTPSPNSVPHVMQPQNFARPGLVPSPFMPQRPKDAPSPKEPNSGFAPPIVHKPAAEQQRPTSTLPAVPGLPSRPVVDAPSFSREDMARLHAGAPALPPTGMPAFSPAPQPTTPSSATPQPALSTPNSVSQPRQNDHIDDLIHSLTNGHAETSSVNTDKTTDPAMVATTTVADKQVASQAQTEPRSKVAGKKSKHANTKTKLVYSDDAVSPEEKRAKAARYIFALDMAPRAVLSNGVSTI